MRPHQLLFYGLDNERGASVAVVCALGNTGRGSTIEDGGEIYSLKLRPLKNSAISLTFRYTGVMLT
jgi:hypothetical protein